MIAGAVGWTPRGFEASPAAVCIAGCAGEVEELGGEGFGWLCGNEINMTKGGMKDIDILKNDDF